MAKRGEMQIMDEDQIKELLISTKGELKNSEYQDKTGLSYNALYNRKKKYGVVKARGCAKSKRRADLAEPYEAIKGIVDAGDASFHAIEQRICKAMVICKEQSPQLRREALQMIRTRLRRNFLPEKDIKIDSHSGYVKALRLPLSQIAAVVTA